MSERTTVPRLASAGASGPGSADCTHYGNYESNLLFLQRVGVLEKGQRILEIGSGHGALLHKLHMEGYDIRGIDVDLESYDISRERFGELPYTLVTAGDLPFDDDHFDVVLSFDVFEHIKLGLGDYPPARISAIIARAWSFPGSSSIDFS